jgi:lipoate-protein ligase A
LGIDLVRRPSGGGAVLHHQEVTYAVIVDGRMCPGGTSVMATYHWLARGLVAGLNLLGIDASVPTTLPSTPATAAFCFVRLTGADLEVGGRKLGGSAQARRNYFVLQHGSLPLRLDRTIIAQLFGELNPFLFTSLEEAAGRQIEPDEFANALVEGFASALGITFELANLMEAEQGLATLLVEGKYGTSQWTRVRKVDPNLRQRIADLLRQVSS